MNKGTQKTEILEWMTKGKTTVIQKEPLKGAAPTNYRPITCLPMMWKILTAHIREKIYYSLLSRGISYEHKGCRKRTRGTEDLLYVDQHIFNERKTRRKNLAMDWIDYKKAYDMVPKAGYYTVSKCIKYLTELNSLSRRPCKPGEWNWQLEDKA